MSCPPPGNVTLAWRIGLECHYRLSWMYTHKYQRFEIRGVRVVGVKAVEIPLKNKFPTPRVVQGCQFSVDVPVGMQDGGGSCYYDVRAQCDDCKWSEWARSNEVDLTGGGSMEVESVVWRRVSFAEVSELILSLIGVSAYVGSQAAAKEAQRLPLALREMGSRKDVFLDTLARIKNATEEQYRAARAAGSLDKAEKIQQFLGKFSEPTKRDSTRWLGPPGISMLLRWMKGSVAFVLAFAALLSWLGVASAVVVKVKKPARCMAGWEIQWRKASALGFYDGDWRGVVVPGYMLEMVVSEKAEGSFVWFNCRVRPLWCDCKYGDWTEPEYVRL